MASGETLGFAPRRSALSWPIVRWVSRVFFFLSGWKATGAPAPYRKYVLLAAPHTSNWDGIILLPASSILGLDLRFLGKDSLFKGPLGWLLRALGGIPIDRSKRQSVVSQAVEWFQKSDDLVLGIAPEGTRAYTEGWKTGFYYIALEAKVPIAMGYIDYAKKEGGIFPEFLEPTGDIEKDFEFFRKWYGPCVAGRPENKGPIVPLR